MGPAGLQVYSKADLWRAYREAFQEFALRVEELESKKNGGSADRTSVRRVILELEKARLHYRQSRDVLASVLLSDRPSRFAEIEWFAYRTDDTQHVREIAQLLWEFEARREGFADDDWYRAEEIIRSARAAHGNAVSGLSVPSTFFCRETPEGSEMVVAPIDGRPIPCVPPSISAKFSAASTPAN